MRGWPGTRCRISRYPVSANPILSGPGLSNWKAAKRKTATGVASWLGGAVLALLAAAMPLAAAPLLSYQADLSRTSVSGLSSGAYMAGQFHIAHSDRLIGAGIVAGGPYDCAQGSVALALNRCMETGLGRPDAAALLSRAQTRARRGEIAPLANLAEDRVYLFSGTRDATVTPPVVAAAAAFYRLAGIPETQIELVDDMPAGHAFVTEDEGHPCSLTEPPYVNDCDHDQAGALLGHLYGRLAPATDPRGALIPFDQAEFLPDPTAHGMAATGFAYVPQGCAETAGCHVHVVFHGCRQTQALVGDAVLRQAGYNRWAESNRMIVLYPQAHETPLNPRSCWDWWGYDDAAYATRDGRQIRAVLAMLERLGGNSAPPDAFCARHRAMNLAHWQAGRARVCDWWFLCAIGSGERIGVALGSSTLFEQPRGSYGLSACSP